MATCLKQSTAVTIRLGPFVDSVDGFTPETALSITQAEVRLSKNHGAFAQKNDVTTATHEEEGWYQVPLNATDTGTLGPLQVAVYVAGALPVWREFTVLPAVVYDALVAGTDNLDVNLAQWLGVAPAALIATNVPANAQVVADKTGYGLAANAVDASQFTQAAADKAWVSAARTLTSLGGALVQEIWDRATSLLTVAGSIGKLLVDNINATIASRATPAQVNSEMVDALDVDTYAESAAPPAATATLAAKIRWLATLARNKINNTNTQQAVRNDGDTLNVGAAPLSDDGTTFIRGKFI